MSKLYKKVESQSLQVWSWNLRGLGRFTAGDCKARQVSQFLADHNEWDILMFQEHKLELDKIREVDRVCFKEGRTWWERADGSKGGVAIAVKNH